MTLEIVFQITITSAIVSALVTGLVSLTNSALERGHKKKELLFKVAFELAYERAKQTLEVAKTNNQTAKIQDPLTMAASYHNWASELFEKGVLPKEATENRTW
jgi:hypothetical protein